MLQLLIDILAQGLESIIGWFSDLSDNIGGFFSDLGSNLGNWFGDVGEWFGSLGSDLGGWFSSLFSSLGNILSYINPFSENFLGYKLIELIQNALSYLFTPTQSNVDSLQNTVNEKFGFIESIKIAVEDIQDMIENIENGTSEFTLDIESDVYEGEVVLFDLAWYAPFKAYGDLVFTGFAYVFFVWRFYRSIPNIINGVGFIGGAIGRGGGDD